MNVQGSDENVMVENINGNNVEGGAVNSDLTLNTLNMLLD
jgi:hypothetical protein